MAHQSLYRKYRPSTFDDVVGQQHIERTLRNAVGDGTVAHAYLFTGPRGTGKTTTARILAKALLCERGPTSEPDGTCEQCVEVAEGRHPDVFELDAASRTGVDNVREEIIGRVQFAPSRGRYKIYIIDEVHMLSTAAFNALLKTLEEPPPHVVFVLCTTHPNKVPETIHSRCQRFDFHRIGVDEIADRLRFIAESEGYRVDRGAFTLIARHADGGMRDAITTLEQLASFTGGEVTVDDVEGLLGEVDSAQLFEVAGLVARRDIAGCFRWVAATAETGTDLAELVRELTGHVRDLFVVAAVGDATGVVDRTTEELAMLQAQAAEFGGPDRLARVLDLLGELAAEMRWSSDPRLSLEVALTRMARPQGEMTLEALAERVEALEAGASVATAVPAAGGSAPATAGARGVSTGSAGEDAPRRAASKTEPPAADATPAAHPGPEAVEPPARARARGGHHDRHEVGSARSGHGQAQLAGGARRGQEGQAGPRQRLRVGGDRRRPRRDHARHRVPLRPGVLAADGRGTRDARSAARRARPRLRRAAALPLPVGQRRRAPCRGDGRVRTGPGDAHRCVPGRGAARRP